MRRKFWLALVALLGVSGSIHQAGATNFSFTGSFTADDNVQLFHFSVGTASTVTLETLSYAGGVNAAGQIIPRGGFDPELALFNSAGLLIDQNDDGGGNVPADSVTGTHYDTFLSDLLQAGDYTVAVMEFDNHAIGPNISDGFTEQGKGDFTAGFDCAANQPAFNDVSGVANGCGRTANWAFDVLNVDTATDVSPSVPEPATLSVFALSLVGFGVLRRRRNA